MTNPLQYISETLSAHVALGVLLTHPAVSIPPQLRARLPRITVDDVVFAMSEYERVSGGRLHTLDTELPAVMERYNAEDYADPPPEEAA